jgi:hypothetical protein
VSMNRYKNYHIIGNHISICDQKSFINDDDIMQIRCDDLHIANIIQIQSRDLTFLRYYLCNG